MFYYFYSILYVLLLSTFIKLEDNYVMLSMANICITTLYDAGLYVKATVLSAL